MGEEEEKGSFHQLCKIHRCLNFSYHNQNRRLKESGKKWSLKDEPVGEGWDLSILSYAVYSSRNQTEVYWPYFPFLFLLSPGHLISRAGTIALGTLGSRGHHCTQSLLVLLLCFASFPNQHKSSLSEILSTALSFWFPKSISCHSFPYPVGSACLSLIKNNLDTPLLLRLPALPLATLS